MRMRRVAATESFDATRLNQNMRGHTAPTVAKPSLKGGVRAHTFRKKEDRVPEKKTIERARKDKREGKAPTTQAGEFVREEIEHIREGKHGARSTKQAIAIGLSKARRAGVKLSPPKPGQASERV